MFMCRYTIYMCPYEWHIFAHDVYIIHRSSWGSFRHSSPNIRTSSFTLSNLPTLLKAKKVRCWQGLNFASMLFSKKTVSFLEISALLESTWQCLPTWFLPDLTSIFDGCNSGRIIQQECFKGGYWRNDAWGDERVPLLFLEGSNPSCMIYLMAMSPLSWLYYQCWQTILSFETASFWFGTDRRSSKNLWNQSQVYSWCIDACLARVHSTGDNNSALDVLSRGCCTSKRKLFQGDWSGGPWRLTSLDLLDGAL